MKYLIWYLVFVSKGWCVDVKQAVPGGPVIGLLSVLAVYVASVAAFTQKYRERRCLLYQRFSSFFFARSDWGSSGYFSMSSSKKARALPSSPNSAKAYPILR